MTRTMVAVFGAVAISTLGGCVPFGSSGYEWDEEYGYYGDLEVEVESLSGFALGVPLDMTSRELLASGSQSGSSAYFALDVGGARAPLAEGEPVNELDVTLDICPIEEWADGGPVSDPELSYLNFYVCDRSYNCLDTWGGDVQIDVVDDLEGVRHVIATGTWASGDRVEMTLRYDPPSE